MYLLFATLKLLPTFYRWRNRGIGKLSNLPRVTQLISGRASIWTPAIWVWDVCHCAMLSHLALITFHLSISMQSSFCSHHATETVLSRVSIVSVTRSYTCTALIPSSSLPYLTLVRHVPHPDVTLVSPLIVSTAVLAFTIPALTATNHDSVHYFHSFNQQTRNSMCPAQQWAKRVSAVIEIIVRRLDVK